MQPTQPRPFLCKTSTIIGYFSTASIIFISPVTIFLSSLILFISYHILIIIKFTILVKNYNLKINNIIGAVKIKLSTLSNIPPCPKSKFPVSFRCTFLFKAEIKISPIKPIRQM